MKLPDYIDNDRDKLEAVLRTLILDHLERELDIATGYFQVEVWSKLQDSFIQLNSLRLLIGRDPSIRPAEHDRIDLKKFYRRSIQEQLEHQEFNLKYKELINSLIAFLHGDRVQVRLYGGAEGARAKFLHAKAYIFDAHSIIGSSNLTPSGLAGNTELNVLIKNGSIARDLRDNWFAKFWNDPCVDLDYKDKLIDALESSKFGSKPYTPYQVFVKALYELFREDTEVSGSGGTALELASFQQEGFERAVRLLDKHQAVMVADAVGLGKTFIGLRLIEHYLQSDRKPGYVPHALVVCPAQLRDLVWRKKLHDFGLNADIISQEEMGRKSFEAVRFNRYDIVVVDESHNFRNSGTSRYENLVKLIGTGKRNKRVVLLTATPINNSIYDLYHQMMLMTRNQERYYQGWGISNLKGYFKALAQGRIEITDLLFETMVRRSRKDVIKRQQAGERIEINGKEIKFPKRQLEQFTYNFEDSFQGLYADIAYQIDQLNLAPYNIKSFKRKQTKTEQADVKRNQALVALMKSLWLKRLESSIVAFESSITAQRDFQSEFQSCLEDGKLLNSKTFRKILAAEMDGEESISVGELLDSLEEVDPTEYDVHLLKEKISEDFKRLEDVLNSLRRIHESVEKGQDYDRKLMAFKELVKGEFKGQKILVFSYFKETAQYLYQELLRDDAWLKDMAPEGKGPVIEIITGATPGAQRGDKVQRFSPISNCETTEDLVKAQENPIDILICTDVLSEGQNLQDAGVLINYDLHWNPVRMIQRAGRIDRIGSPYDLLYIYNCFPEEGLERLLGLVRRLQERISTIDNEVGLDGSVLGEEVSEKSLEDLMRLKKADSEAEKQQILDELETSADLASLDEMRFPLMEFLQQVGLEAIQDIPMGIHSTRTDGLDGIFLSFKAKERTFWHFYPRVNGAITTAKNKLVDEKSKIFKLIKCAVKDYPKPEDLLPVPFDNAIFAVLQGAVENVLDSLKKTQSSTQLSPKLSKLMRDIHIALTQTNLLDEGEVNQESIDRILMIISQESLRTYESDIRKIWNQYKEDRDKSKLVDQLDEYFVANQIGEDLLAQLEPENPLETITREDIQLVCYEWFKPQ